MVLDKEPALFMTSVQVIISQPLGAPSSYCLPKFGKFDIGRGSIHDKFIDRYNLNVAEKSRDNS